MEGQESGTNGHVPQYGFAIDQRKCIGCHACTVACKAENEVPVGQFRTWVKYTDKGTFPDVKRHFTVLRCNHCDDAPCVTICPVNALKKRPDAIVDLDRDACIGCRACMQACPYDALYLNEDTGTAEKCHYCAHRTERGLEPACVVVCPERAIIPGDLSDPESEISQLIQLQPTSRRKVEKGTKPRVYYVDALPESLQPGTAREEPSGFLWSDRATQPPPVPEGFEPPRDLVNALDVAHPPVWGWHIWTYLLTKNMSAGAMLAAPVVALAGVATGTWQDLAPEIASLVFLGITLFLLVHDLGRPERFLRLLFSPNTKSWLVRGAWVLNVFALFTVASLVLRLFEQYSYSDVLRYVNIPAAILASGYSAWLFAQCKGRDLWTESGTFMQLVLRAATLGVAIAAVLASSGRAVMTLGAVYVVLLVALLVLEFGGKQREGDLLRAHKIFMATDGPRREALAGLASSALLLIAGALGGAFILPLAAIALAATAAGQFVRDKAWIESGQAVPNS